VEWAGGIYVCKVVFVLHGKSFFCLWLSLAARDDRYKGLTRPHPGASPHGLLSTFTGIFNISRKCAVLCPTRATWKLGSLKMPGLRGYHAFMIMCETSYGGLSLDLLRVLLWHRQRVPQEIASYQVQPYILRIIKRLQHALPWLRQHRHHKTCQGYYFLHGGRNLLRRP
jgi:hypothetical protein